jgi:2-polyprenyl-3-methyl-5-hydroxy-6-metoxy-1,4-benzoquinol methylase
MKNVQLCCRYCKSENYTRLNTYKHHAVVCSDCGNVSHFKKNRYLFEYFFPRSLAKRILPPKAFLRLYSDRNDFVAAEFYDTGAFDSTKKTEWRRSEVSQVIDQLDLIEFNPKGKRILDISGGPGVVGHELSLKGANVVVTEYSETQVKSMNENLNVSSIKFDYLKDSILEIMDERFDLIMIRSSIIFCPNLDKFVAELTELLNPSGVVFVESILPTLGEIFWWQQLEYKFPFIYTQETIEKCFYKTGLTLKYGYRDYGGYIGVKRRSYAEFSKFFFTWFLEYPMILGYILLNIFKKPAIDQSLGHKMITQFWVKGDQEKVGYLNYNQGGINKSKTFGFKYNGYLKN